MAEGHTDLDCSKNIPGLVPRQKRVKPLQTFVLFGNKEGRKWKRRGISELKLF